ncbi:unnamed protein product [Blepharisma stoltei]|uniref:Uncharacterized protein n=1 Tax=Blepharisma stoltei TaxID=1481888 RepID=A0AAU9IWN1_9CILI|nr:unnamed protein product [Blepharisma stoltei]
METPGVSDDEEFFDAFETTMQLKLNLSNIDIETKSLDSLSVAESEPKQIENSHSPLYDSTPQIFLSDYSTYNSLSHKDPDLSKSNISTPSIKNLIKKHHKDYFEFADAEQIQEIDLDSNTSNKILVLKFSPDGRFLAISGQNPEIKLYEVYRQRVHGPQNLFYDVPYNVMIGHTLPVLDISWSQSSTYFLSASEDWNVFLWSIANSTSVLQFKHPNTVSCVCFHPFNANHFLSGCHDKTVRIWNIPNYTVVCSAEAPEIITAGSFTPNGDLILLGLLHGQCLVYEPQFEEEKLNLLTQINCKNSRGRKSMGRRVTGFDFLDEQQALITTNDSRMRLYNLKDFTLKQKYKGLVNEKFPIKSTFSHNLMHAVSGSENGCIYVWNTYCTWAPKINPIFSRKKNFKNYSYECFPASNTRALCSAIFAPDKVVKEVQTRNKSSKSDHIVSHIVVVACEGKLKIFYNQFKIMTW